MILKKPYAFFIKNFKLFHLIIFLLSSVLLYRTSLVYSFIVEYLGTSTNLIGKELTSVLFTGWSYVLVALITIINIVLIVVMVKKQKPYMYYIVNLILYIFVLIVYIISHGVIADLEVMLVESKRVLAIRDILNIARMLETISIIFYLVRATGFDIKKFDFVRDLQDLDISEEDSEEYEVAVEFEKNIFLRKFKRIFRNFKYYYKENKFIINIILSFFIGIIFLFVYFSIDKYSKIYSEGNFVSVDSMDIGVIGSFVVKNDYKNDVIDSDNMLVAVKISLKSSFSQSLVVSKFVLSTNNVDFYSTNKYSNLLVDLGSSYNNQKIGNEFSTYLLVYEVPLEYKDSNFVFKYIDKVEQKNNKTKINSIDIRLSPINIDDLDIVEGIYSLSNEIDTTSDISTYKVLIKDFDIAYKFTGTYSACISDDECYDYKEILLPSSLSNNEKVLLKLDGYLTYDNVIGGASNIVGFMNLFGSIEYTYNGINKIEKGDFASLSFSKVNDSSYYLEVNKEIIDSSNVKLVFNIRNNRYVYILKGGSNE